jgi:hypothetical protein
MKHRLEFQRLVLFDPGKPGIPVTIKIRTTTDSTEFTAKLDTGATICIFERRRGEAVGITVEMGIPNHRGNGPWII